MAIEKTSGFVIKAVDYQESGRIVALLSPRLGKISLLAKGARRPESRFGAALDLLNLIEVVFYQGKGLKLLKDAAIIAYYPNLKQDYERLEAAMQAARSLNLLLREGQGEGQVVELFEEFLRELNERARLQLELLKLGFKLKLIDLLGFGPELERCTACRRVPSSRERVWFSIQGGGEGEAPTRQATSRMPLPARRRRTSNSCALPFGLIAHNDSPFLSPCKAQ